MNFSIIIPTFNREKKLKKLLTVLTTLNYPENHYEIIVVDNGSTDHTQKMVKSFAEKYSNIKSCYEVKPGPSFARNRGIREAAYDRLIFIDDDCLVSKQFLQKYKENWELFPTARMIGGPISAKKEQGRFSQNERNLLRKHHWCFGIMEFPSSRTLSLGELLFSGNFSYHLPQKFSQPLFDERLGRVFADGKVLYAEDFELCSRTILAGETVQYCHDLQVVNVIDSTRFSERYLEQRYWQAGIETYIMDRILQEKFPTYAFSDRESICFHTIDGEKERFFRSVQFLFKNLKMILREFLSSRYKRIYTLSYFFNGKYFYERKSVA